MMTSASHQFSVDAISLFVALICACVVIGHLLEENRWINESITSLLIGLCTGILILLTTEGKSSHILEFDEELFFIYLLPPIIFNAGFKVKKKHFFRNFMTIMLFGAVGTFISFSIISFGTAQLFKKLDIGFLEMPDYLAIGAILSATDSVCTLQVLNQEETPLLYSLVFGESVVNDATAVVLFNAIKRFDISRVNSGIALQFVGNFFSLFITSTLLGVLIGLLCAYIIRKLFIGRNKQNFSSCTDGEGTEDEVTDREVALMILMAYLSYVMAELFDLSGILTVFFCGIVMSHYSWHNVTEYSRITTKHAFATLSFVAEIFIFLYVGMDALDIEKWKFVSNSCGKSVAVSSILLGLVLVGRAAFIFPLSFISNLTKESKSEKIEFKQQVTIWWAGLMRGAVSMALAYNQFTRSGHTQQPGNAVMITSTITVVLFSTVVIGLTTKPLLKFLLPPPNQLIRVVSSEPSSPKSLTMPLIGSWQDLGAETGCPSVCRPSSLRMLLNPTNTVHYYWRKFDDTYMRPVFGGRGFVPRVPGSQTDAG